MSELESAVQTGADQDPQKRRSARRLRTRNRQIAGAGCVNLREAVFPIRVSKMKYLAPLAGHAEIQHPECRILIPQQSPR